MGPAGNMLCGLAMALVVESARSRPQMHDWNVGSGKRHCIPDVMHGALHHKLPTALQENGGMLSALVKRSERGKTVHSRLWVA